MMKPFAQQHLDDLVQAHADFMQAIAPAEAECLPAEQAVIDTYDDFDDVDWNDPRLLAIWDLYHKNTAAARKKYFDRIGTSEARYQENRIAVMGR